MEDWQKGSGAFESIAAYTGWAPRIQSSAGLGHANALLVSQNFLGTLGIPLRLGQDFTRSGNENDCLNQAIVTDGYWRTDGRRQCAGWPHDPTGLSDITSSSEFWCRAQRWVIWKHSVNHPFSRQLAAIQRSIQIAEATATSEESARLKPGIPISAALEDLIRTQKNLSRAYPRYYPPAFEPTIMPLSDFVSGTRDALCTLRNAGRMRHATADLMREPGKSAASPQHSTTLGVCSAHDARSATAAPIPANAD